MRAAADNARPRLESDRFHRVTMSPTGQERSCLNIRYAGLSTQVHQSVDGSQMTTTPPTLESALTCPQCGHVKREIMRTDACQFFHECEHCKTVLRPNPGDCCVFCSYGSVKCPLIQMEPGCSGCRAC
jgi:hypothetical protein